MIKVGQFIKKEKLIPLFLAEYNDTWVYMGDLAPERIAAAVSYFDHLAESSKSFAALVGDVARARGDYFSSDKEAAAFVITCRRLRLF
jgi:hypothetical protein